MSDTAHTPNAFYYEPPRHIRAWYATWRWLGFGHPYIEHDAPEGYLPGPLTTNVRISFSWGDRLRILLTGRGIVQTCTWTDVEVVSATSVSKFRVPMPFER